MSTTSSTRRQEPTTTSTTSRRDSSTTSRQQSVATTTTSEDGRKSTTIEQHFSLIELDTSGATSSPTTDSLRDIATTTTPSFFKATCASDNDCDSDKICSKGVCSKVIDAAPFGPAGGSSLQPPSHMSTGAAIGIGLGVVSLMLLLFGLVIWLWRRRVRKPLHVSVEAPPANRTRSASSATDQKTLVASLPNSPQYAGFREQRDQTLTASFAQLVNSNKIVERSRAEKERATYDRRSSPGQPNDRTSCSGEKCLPRPPTDMPLPPPPAGEKKKYTVNVNINKSMIFDDVMFNMASTPRDTGTPRDSGTPRNQMPKYRFEEYHPPITSTPPISIRQISSKQTSEIEMKSYPRKDSSSTIQSTSDDEKDVEASLRRKSTLTRLESKPPQLPLPELLPPPSPSFSFRSYDWYQDIIGTEQTNLEDTVLGATTPSIPDRNPNRTPTQATFGASLSSNPQNLRSSLMPAPLSPNAPSSPGRASFLHPSSAALASPTSPNFRLSPTVYVMPSRPPKAQPMRASLRSAMTEKSHLSAHMSRSWLPEDGLYLPQDDNDSFMIFKRRLSDDSRPTSYSPLQ